jgi:hypothetical protein
MRRLTMVLLSWFEAPGCHHRISDNASKTEAATLIATMVTDTEVFILGYSHFRYSSSIWISAPIPSLSNTSVSVTMVAIVGAHVLKGTVLNKMNEEPMKTIQEGGSWFEAPGWVGIRCAG